MKIQALVFDLDGTAIPKRENGMPSKAVIDAVKKAKKYCHVSIATGRPLELCKPVIEALEIEDLCILNGGTHIYSQKTQKNIWKKEIEAETLNNFLKKIQHLGDYMIADEKELTPVKVGLYQPQTPIALSCIFSTTLEHSKEIVSIANLFDEITACSMSSWKDGTFDVHITHKLGNKKYALETLLSKLNVLPENSMVVGDGGNDLPLFEVGGLKIAMGNAVDELKSKADWIAPTVGEDGLATAIEKYILNV